jgi:hypothetical protein
VAPAFLRVVGSYLLDRNKDRDRRHAAGSVQGLHLVVSDINAARAELAEREVDVAARSRISGALYVSFCDLGGNSWAVQQLPYRD